MSSADPKPPPRIRDPALFKILHADPHKACVLCESTEKVEFHHVLPRGGQNHGDDVRENLVPLCAHHHRRITWNYADARAALGEYLKEHRPDTLDYVRRKKGDEAGRDWLERRLFVSA